MATLAKIQNKRLIEFFRNKVSFYHALSLSPSQSPSVSPSVSLPPSLETLINDVEE